MQIHDITLAIEPDMPIWPNNPGVELERVKRIETGGSSNVSRLSLGVHTGTHVDAPVHFLPGEAGVEALSLKTLIGRAHVVEVRGVDEITAETLRSARIPARTRRVLFKTRNSEWWAKGEKSFREDFVGLTADAAEYLVSRRIQLVGVDYLSVGPWQNGRPTHEVLLRAGVVIVEGLNLSEVNPGRYTLFCLPLKVAGSDGAPARAVLVGF